MNTTQTLSPLLVVPREYSQPLLHDGEPVVDLRLRWAEGGADCPRRLARLLSRVPAVWQRYWEAVTVPLAAEALAACRARSRPFTPWLCTLDTRVTQHSGCLLCVQWEAVLRRDGLPAVPVRHTLVWDLSADAPRPLSSFLSRHFPHAAALRAVAAQAPPRTDRLALWRRFSPRRFFLRGEEVVVFYPPDALGPGEGFAEFPVGRLPEGRAEDALPVP